MNATQKSSIAREIEDNLGDSLGEFVRVNVEDGPFGLVATVYASKEACEALERDARTGDAGDGLTLAVAARRIDGQWRISLYVDGVE